MEASPALGCVALYVVRRGHCGIDAELRTAYDAGVSYVGVGHAGSKVIVEVNDHVNTIHACGECSAGIACNVGYVTVDEECRLVEYHPVFSI